MAEVAVAGPFSSFPGIERHLAMLEGAMELRFADHAVRLDPASAAHRFAGDAPVDGLPLGGVARDLNLMVDPARFAGRLERVAGEVALHPGPGCQQLLVLTAPCPATACLPALEWGDCLWFGPGAGAPSHAATGWLATITAR